MFKLHAALLVENKNTPPTPPPPPTEKAQFENKSSLKNLEWGRRGGECGGGGGGNLGKVLQP